MQVFIAGCCLLLSSVAWSQTMFVNASVLNLRSEPEVTNSNVTAQLSFGDSVIVISQQGDWDQIEFGNNRGYVFSRFLKSKEEIITSRGESLPCNASLWNHVYHPDRLEVHQQCLTVTGIIENKRPEKDGDIHMQLRLDKGQDNLLNERNITGQNGDLVIEPICTGSVSQEDAVDACAGYMNNTTIPSKGDHVSITGCYVRDTEHGWMEIHPVSSIIIIGKKGTVTTNNSSAASTIHHSDSIVGYTSKGQPIYCGPRGGLYHYSANGNKVYVKK